MAEYQYLIIFAVTMLAGAINSVAGGGSFLTFPVFIFCGLSASTANIMSTIALAPASLSSTYAYRKEFAASGHDRKQLVCFALISFAGAAVGTLTFLNTSEQKFEALVPWLLLAATLIFTFGKSGIGKLNIRTGSPILCYGLQFIIAIYGGYFGAGIGILMLAMLQLMGMTNIHQMNALKTLLACAIYLVAVPIFLFSGEVLWPLGWWMMLAGILGGFAGARLALLVSPHSLRRFIIAIAWAMTAYFFIVS